MSDGLRLKNLSVPGRVADVSLHVPPGTITVVVGPSGSGKTSLLSGVAGLVHTRGRVLVDGRDVSAVRPQDRPTVSVAQEPALFESMSVADNVGFGLDDARMPEAVRTARIQVTMADLGLLGLAARRPGHVSGGQRQRTALARALAVRAPVLLLDEPLSHLDSSRHTIQREILTQVRRHRLSCLYVTHDIDEACQVADSLVVVQAGRVLQSGSPREVFERPRGKAVARTMGIPNTFACLVEEVRAGRRLVRLGSHRFEVDGDAPPGPALVTIMPGGVALRACAEQSATADHTGHGQVIRAFYARGQMIYDVETDFGTVVAESGAAPLTPTTWVHVEPRAAWVTREAEGGRE